MRKLFFALFAMVAVLGLVAFSSRAENISVRGDYVEVRTASVFAGACHFNGEVTTQGREAMMAWSFTSGKWQDIDLTGVRLMAIVTSDSNLSETNASRQSEIIIDSTVSRPKALAALSALKERHASALGNILKVRFAPINFVHSGRTYEVTSDGATINVEAMPNDLCCKMPNLVWYTPLVGLENRKVGYTTKALYDGHGVGEPWSRSDENSAFYGSFAF
jgi:hypothetical protein